ncbi:hypothetical protein [Gordonia sp. NB41Y]|uniref:hypothetical protein n=1 Tax=Gordonia sp. NB41Y TaxID=875808 RepID=UPI0006B22251|nr:hypothetical protein [Gordonia sp. NB41Y]KOY49173.1 hypothetical protein ISGA_11835 [Gordonia sp. NB41Y]WLP89455.1 hypothetical protein Q9K23_17985 [Gordonia sp. NB41Y]
MTVQSEDKRDAIDLLRAVVDEDPKRWADVQKRMYGRYGAPERVMAVLAGLALQASVPGDRAGHPRVAGHCVSAPVQSEIEVG